ncbi:hypothetical protein H5410_021279 [Solanum commersonii]|uniref:Uncharacterized protein n=1 Tax=Solanum commersonii TaxID=4109 RepID=A0A9J5ZGP9_SOLCO|nr:hypothetical protein H5410_021279 [Solanum commersonii]
MLTHLKLFNCIFKKPNSFLGFQTLIVLQLEKITFVLAIEFYTINVPLLVKLTIELYDGTQYLNIVFSSELKSLVIIESHYNLDLNRNCFKNCRKLTYLYLVIENFNTSFECRCSPKGASLYTQRLWHLNLGVNFNELGVLAFFIHCRNSSSMVIMRAYMTFHLFAASTSVGGVVSDPPMKSHNL